MNRDLDDRALMLRVGRDRDTDALSALVARWDAPVYAFLAKASRDAVAAQDMRQEVFLRVYRYGAGYNPEYAFSTWLFRIVGNVLRTWRAGQARRRSLEGAAHGVGDSALAAGMHPRDAAAERETHGRVREAIAALAVEDRELLLLRFDRGFCYREIGEMLDVPETTVKSRVYKLLARLRPALADVELPERSMHS